MAIEGCSVRVATMKPALTLLRKFEEQIGNLLWRINSPERSSRSIAHLYPDIRTGK
jgi:hypothetical protein